MATKIFITGATGYIGGDALYAISKAHPDWEITALVRNTDKGTKVAAQYPRVRLVYGDLDDSELLERESRAAGIVGHFAHADHAASASAIIRGLESRPASGPAGFLVHTSGAGILLLPDIQASTFGTVLREKQHDDLGGVAEITTGLPDAAPHRNVDKLVLAAANRSSGGGARVRPAIVSPPTIYGIGRGPDSRRSHQLPELCRATLERGAAFRVNEGLAYWNNVHVTDLSALYVKLLEEAAAGGSTAEWPGKPDIWGETAYFFCENGEHVWADVSQWVADEGVKQGLLATNEVKSVSAEEAGALSHYGFALWGANSRGRALRAREALKWSPTGPSFQDEVANTLRFEAERLGLKPGHAQVAAGNA